MRSPYPPPRLHRLPVDPGVGRARAATPPCLARPSPPFPGSRSATLSPPPPSFTSLHSFMSFPSLPLALTGQAPHPEAANAAFDARCSRSPQRGKVPRGKVPAVSQSPFSNSWRAEVGHFWRALKAVQEEAVPGEERGQLRSPIQADLLSHSCAQVLHPVSYPP